MKVAMLVQKHPNELTLDRKNPRFGLEEASSEREALSILLSHANLKELWGSIEERGYEPFEPLVATEEGGVLVVLEGNRRLAAVKFLLDPSLAQTDAEQRRIPRLSANILKTCETLPVYIVRDRNEADGYIGFKHVNGPARWSSLAKAKFGVSFYESMNGRLSPSERMLSLTRQLGDSRGLILRLLVAFKIVEQSIKLGIFESLDITSDDIEFSHLYTMINNPESREFIGLSKAPLSENLIVANPIPITHEENLKELLGWIYGRKSVIKAQGTDRPRLQRVLANSDALAELRLTGDITSAEAVAGLQSEDWLEILAKAAGHLQKANTEASVVLESLGQQDTEHAIVLVKRMERQIKQISSLLS